MVLVFVFLLGLALSFAYWKIKSSLKEQIFSLVEVQKVSQISKVNPKELFRSVCFAAFVNKSGTV